MGGGKTRLTLKAMDMDKQRTVDVRWVQDAPAFEVPLEGRPLANPPEIHSAPEQRLSSPRPEVQPKEPLAS